MKNSERSFVFAWVILCGFLATITRAYAVAPYPLDQTFKLHSLPGATKIAYIDANGYTETNGTTWLGYDKDGDPTTFNDNELEEIQLMFERVKEDFLPFNINITTEPPPPGALDRDLGGDQTWGVRVVIYQGPGTNGGHATVGSFDSLSDVPAWADQNGVGTGNKNLGEVISHEIGHTLGLSHDGRTSPQETYYGGHGSGETGWAPIMGVGYNKTVTQWSRGAYANANNPEDDLLEITSMNGNGFTYRVDDYGSTLASAFEIIPFAGIAIDQSGIIERNTDKDVFRFNVLFESPIDLKISPAAIGPNLDILATLYDSNGVPVAVSNPLDRLDAEFAMTLASGDYYIEIDGTGNTNDPVTGYDDYGSLGFFNISGTVFSKNVGDIDFNGQVNSADIDAFKAGWLTSGYSTVEEQIRHGDLNLDGITDLKDAYILRTALVNSGNGALLGIGDFVPEPSAIFLAIGAIGGLWLKRRVQR